MPPVPYSYPWPASALTADNMRLLHRVRESNQPRIPITRLIAAAVREAYGRPEQAGHYPAAKEESCAA